VDIFEEENIKLPEISKFKNFCSAFNPPYEHQINFFKICPESA